MTSTTNTADSPNVRAAEATGHTVGCTCCTCDGIRNGVAGDCLTCGRWTVGEHIAGTNIFAFQCSECAKRQCTSRERASA